MKTVKLRGIVVKVLKLGVNHCTFIFNNHETGNLIIAVDRTHGLFYEIRNGMILSIEVSLRTFQGKGKYIRNSLSVINYEIQKMEGGG